MRISTAATLLALTVAPLTGAQSVRVTEPVRTFSFSGTASQDPNRAMLGLSTSPSGRRDTLGLLITAVTAGSPAEKAGLEEGNRLTSINGVNLKLSRDDAGDDDMQGVNQNRLTREMRKVKAGEEVALEVWGSGRSRSVKVKTVTAEDLSPRRVTVTMRDEDRVALGLFLSSTGSKRDTIGVFVQQVVEGGPAEKAGITEGDRIASINGVDLRVAREDAGDWSMGSSRIDRLEREVRKLKAGDAADLVVVSGGRSRTVKVSAVRARDLPGGEGFSYRTGPGLLRFQGPGSAGGVFTGPNGTMRVMPKIRIGSGVDYEHPGDLDRMHLEQSLQGLHGLRSLDGLKSSLEGLRSLEGLQSLEKLKSLDGVQFYRGGRSYDEFDGLLNKLHDLDDDIKIRLEDKVQKTLKDKIVTPSRLQLKDKIVIPSKIKTVNRIVL